MPAAARFSCWIWEPVRIDDLARNLIRLSGFEPDVDIEVRYTGLRPGEKLYEEMLMQEEGLRSTPNHLIHIGRPLDIDVPAFERQLTALAAACRENSPITRRQAEDRPRTCHKCREETQRYERRDTPACISYSTS